jgi:hypothetical protein
VLTVRVRNSHVAPCASDERASELPSGPWLLHPARLGNLTNRWIDLHARPSSALESRLIGLEIAEGVERGPRWRGASDRRDIWLSYKGMNESGGQSLIWLARLLRENAAAIVHAHYRTAAPQRRRFARALGVPLVASFYGYRATMRRFTQTLWRRVLVGGGRLESELRPLGVAEGVGDRVKWLGPLAFTELMRAVASASVVVVPSWEAADGDSDGGAPVTPIEAQWLGFRRW